MKLYKLTDEDGKTFNDTQWGEGVSHSGTGEGELCGPGFIHAYTDPLLAVLLNPIHAVFRNPQLWEAEGEVVKSDHGLKVGCVTLTTIKRIPLPRITINQCISFGIHCAIEVYKNANWLNWAHNWLNGANRSASAAFTAARAANAATYAANAASAAFTAAYAAFTAADAAARAANAAVNAANAAEAANAAAYAANAAANAADIDLIAIAKRAMEVE